MSDEQNTLYGLPVFNPRFQEAADAEELPAPETVAWRLSEGEVSQDEDVPFADQWRRLLDRVDTTRVTALVIGSWDGYDVTQIGFDSTLADLVDAKDRFPALRALFLADVESDIQHSWVSTGDMTPVLEAFPLLEELGVCGSGHAEEPLALRPVKHSALRRLRIESGGLPGSVVRAVIESELPALEDLDLWLGVTDYGGDTELSDLAPLLAGDRFPALRHLALRNSEVQDEIASAIAQAPVVAGLRTLNLSLGVLTDVGAEALLAGQPLTHLERLDLHHHFLSDAMVRRVRETLEPSGVEVDLSEQEKAEVYNDEVYRYVALAE